MEQNPRLCAIAVAILTVCGAPVASAAGKPTFYKDVQPLMERNCVSCHRPGEAAPMSFLSYKEVRPFAAAIRSSVAQRKMPPWQADPGVGHFGNDRSLSQADIDTIVEWAKAGAPEGNPKDAPKLNRTFAEGWSIGKPDVVIEMPEPFTVPATGTIPYYYVIVPTKFEKDTWIQAAEARPANRAVNHHIIAYVRVPGSKWLKGAEPGKVFLPGRGEGVSGEHLTGYAPGTIPDQMKPGQAMLIPAGSDIVFQLHWTANGKEATDHAKLGLILARETPKERVITLESSNYRFEIPPGADNHKVDGRMTLQTDATLEALTPHMHLRGKAFAMSAKLPDGTVRELLKVPAYDFNWQLTYALKEPIKLPAGTQILATGWFDNSPNNRFNPDASKTVRFGEQSWEEMMIGFFQVSVPVNVTRMDLLRAKKPATSSGALE